MEVGRPVGSRERRVRRKSLRPAVKVRCLGRVLTVVAMSSEWCEV